MALNIKNPEAHQLATAIAEQTGETLTDVVTGALRGRLAEVSRKRPEGSLREEIRSLQAFVASIPDRDTRTADELIGYDEFGLPG